MKSFPFLFLLIIFSQIPSPVVAAGAILVLGDSWASATGDYLKGICNPPFGSGGTEEREVQNDGKSGSTAAEWASQELAKKSILKSKVDHQYVWLSIGGNDFIASSCDIDIIEDVTNNILTIISHIIDSSSNDNLKILFFGYSYPSDDICGGGKTAGLFEETMAYQREAIVSSSYSERVEVIEISDYFVTSASAPLSDERWYEDEIHLNIAGYIKLFSGLEVQHFFGCVADDDHAPTPAPESSLDTNHDSTDYSDGEISNAVNLVGMFASLAVLFF